MELLSTFGATRRSRRRGVFWGLALLAALGLLAVAGVYASYEVGRSQSRFEIARLGADLAAQQELGRLLSERAATAEEEAASATTRSARLQQALTASTPRPELRDLTALLDQRLSQGLPADRLAFLLREAQPERRCAKDTDSRRILVHTSISTVPPAVASFGKDRITVSAEGSPTRPGAGQGEPAFDPLQPVTLRFLKIGREVSTAAGRLPLSHSIVLGDQEFLFAVKPADKPGSIDLVAQSCAYP